MHEEAIRKADVLIEALGFIRKFHGKFTVIKLGGSVMEDPESLRALLVDVVFMQTVGLRPVVVHGGGKAITVAMEQAGLKPHFVQGRRFTDEATLAIVAIPLLGLASWLALVALAPMPLGLWLWSKLRLRHDGPTLNRVLASTAALMLAMSSLLALGIALG